LPRARNRRIARTDVEALDIGQHQVENDHVHRLAPMQGEPARPVLGVNDVKTRLAEILADHIGKTGIVFDQEDAFAHGSSSHDVAVNRDASAPTTAG
jgi:hypothetical protein